MIWRSLLVIFLFGDKLNQPWRVIYMPDYCPITSVLINIPVIFLRNLRKIQMIIENPALLFLIQPIHLYLADFYILILHKIPEITRSFLCFVKNRNTGIHNQKLGRVAYDILDQRQQFIFFRLLHFKIMLSQAVIKNDQLLPLPVGGERAF